LIGECHSGWSLPKVDKFREETMSYPRQRLVLVVVLGLVSLGIGLVKLAYAKEPLSVAHLAGPWQAALIWSGSGCGPASGLVNFTLDSNGTTNTGKLVFHTAGCGDSILSNQTFTVQTLNPDGSGTANLSCGAGCGWEFNIQVDRDRNIFNLTDVDPANPGNFVAGTAIRQRTEHEE
jgi:hypothetical protein